MSESEISTGEAEGYRVFIVEDHPVMRKALANLLRRQQDLTHFGEAVSAEEALEKIPGSLPDLVLVDISLPGMDGIHLVKALKTLLPELPILVLSGYNSSVYEEPARRAGALGYVVKGDGNAILAAIRQARADGANGRPRLSP